MSAIVAAASPIELAALWRLGLLTARDVVQVCLAWLEEGLDETAPDIAVLAGATDPRLADLRPRFARALADLTGPPPSREQALPIALRLHLAVALVQPDERFLEAMDLVMARFKDAGDPGGPLAEQTLDLQQVHGAYDELDDLLRGEAWVDDPAAMTSQCLAALREETAILHAHLATL